MPFSSQILRQALRNSGRGDAVDARVGIIVRKVIDIGEKRPEAFFVFDLALRERQRRVGASVEGAVEGDQAASTGVIAHELDHTLNNLNAKIQKKHTPL